MSWLARVAKGTDADAAAMQTRAGQAIVRLQFDVPAVGVETPRQAQPRAVPERLRDRCVVIAGVVGLRHAGDGERTRHWIRTNRLAQREPLTVMRSGPRSASAVPALRDEPCQP